MFYFRINRIKIYDNGVNRLIKKLDKAQVILVSFITTGDVGLPSLKEYLRETDVAKKDALLENAIKQVISSRVLTPVHNVKDMSELTFGPSGYSLYTSNEIPDNFNWQLVVIGSKQNIRDTATMINDIISDDSFDTFKTGLKALLEAASVTNPVTAVVAAAIEIGQYIAGVTLKIYAKKKDDQLGLVYQSWNRTEHYPHGIRNKEGSVDLTNNMEYDYSMFGVETGILSTQA
ncbi:MAG TPA: hypothetical protein PLW44_00450 [Chitinophagales bacterium]|nr:hypothetical protein [Chitinophagales bacterium]